MSESQKSTACPDETKNPLGVLKVSKLLFQFALPSIIALLVNSLYNLVDQIFIGHIADVGRLCNEATTVAFPFVTLSLALSLLIGAGCAANYNLRLGRGDTDGAAKCVGNALLLLAGVSVVLLVVCQTALKPLLVLFGRPSEDVLEYAVQYARIIVCGIPFAMAGTALSHMIRADGSPLFSMTFMLIGAAINTILDPIFIFVCNWGIRGAAWATIIGQILSFFLAAAYLRRFKHIRLRRAHFKPTAAVIGSVLMLGISYFITQMSFFVVQIVTNNLINTYKIGTAYENASPLAAFGIMMKVSQILMSFLIGTAQGSQPIVGFNYGARKFDRVKRAYLIAVLTATAFAALGELAFQLFSHPIMLLFGNSDVGAAEIGAEQLALYYEFADKCFRIYLMLICTAGFQIVSSNFFQAIGKPIKSGLLALSRQIGFLIPCLVIFTLTLGLDGILYAGPVADGLSAVFAGVFVLLELKALNKKIQEMPRPQTENAEAA